VDGKAALAPVQVSLQAADSSAGIEAFRQIGRAPTTIEQDGSFLISAVPEATYRVQPAILSASSITFQNRLIARGSIAGQVATAGTSPSPPPLPATAYVSDVRQGGTSVYDDGISIGTTLVSPLEVHINTNGGTIEGTVVSAGRQALAAGAVVVLMPPTNRRQNPALYRTTSTDDEGSFTMSAVPPGPYKLFAWQSIPAGAHLNPDFMKTYEDRGASITVSAGATVSQPVVLISAERAR